MAIVGDGEAMPPARRRALAEALATIDAEADRGREVRLRITGIGGAVVEGPLLSAANGHLAVRGPDGAVIDFAPEEIGTLAIARPQRGREWALAGVGIVTGAATIGGLVSLPVVGEWLRTSSQYVVVAVFYAGAGLLVVLLAATRLRQWLTRWDTLFDEPTP